MQSNTITIGATGYDRFKETPDKTTYVSPTHSVSKADLLMLGRTVATNDSSNAKSRANFVIDIDKGDANGTKGRVYVNNEVSYPQWADQTELQAIIDAAALFYASPEYAQLVLKQSI